MINDVKQFGTIVLFVDEGIDTADIIIQKMFEISNSDSYDSLLERTVVECDVILQGALSRIKKQNFVRLKQKRIRPIGSYCCKRIAGDENVGFNLSSRRIFNFVRAISAPEREARFACNRKGYVLHEYGEVGQSFEYISTVGEIICKSVDGNLVKTGDSVISITRISSLVNDVIQSKVVPSFGLGTRRFSL